MRNSSASRWGAIPLLVALAARPASAGPPQDGVACLERLDVPCAGAAAEAALAAAPADPATLLFAAEVAFHQGRYVEAARRLEAAVATAGTVPPGVEAMRTLYAGTVEATAGVDERRRAGVIVRWSPGVDGVLVDDAFEALAAARGPLGSVFGELPPDPILVEIYPSGRRFRLATGFGLRPGEGGGVVGLSRWARILILSPRAVAHGYAWRDSLVHEYVHQIVSWASAERTPVWLQEGIARYLDRAWRQAPDAALSPWEQTLVASALARDDLVTFDEIRTSIAFLPSDERKALAYAQMKVLVATAVRRGGGAVLRSTLQAVRSGADPAEALAAAAGYASTDAWLADAQQAMRRMDLVDRRLGAPRVLLDGEGGDHDADPILAERRDLADHARLGDLLLEAGRPRAALVEYDRAHPADEPPSPLVAVGIARCHHGLGDPSTALAVLRASATDYPEVARTWKVIGELERAAGRTAEALTACRAAVEIDPFDPDVRGCIADLARQGGLPELADRAARARRILLGGADPGSAE